MCIWGKCWRQKNWKNWFRLRVLLFVFTNTPFHLFSWKKRWSPKFKPILMRSISSAVHFLSQNRRLETELFRALLVEQQAGRCEFFLFNTLCRVGDPKRTRKRFQSKWDQVGVFQRLIFRLFKKSVIKRKASEKYSACSIYKHRPSQLIPSL